jgi:hypothetical protein
MFLLGCSSPVTTGDGATNGPAEGPITLILANTTDVPVDPHLYIIKDSNSAGKDLSPSDLFANFNGSTTIKGGDSVSLSFDCGQVSIITSDQAKFGSLLPDFQGGQSQESPVISISTELGTEPHCGQVIILRFSKDDQGVYHTNWKVAEPGELQ